MKAPRHWRTRPDEFAEVWAEITEQLRANPEGHRYTVDNAYLAGPRDAQRGRQPALEALQQFDITQDKSRIAEEALALYIKTLALLQSARHGRLR